MKKLQNDDVLILDTNVLLSYPEILNKYPNKNLMVPLAVIEELDEKKHEKGEIGYAARKAIRTIEKQDLNIIPSDKELLKKHSLENTTDNLILCSALKVGGNSIIVSNDYAMRIKAKPLNIAATNYDPRNNETIEMEEDSDVFVKSDKPYSGVRHEKVADQVIDKCYDDGLKFSDVFSKNKSLFPNESLVLESMVNPDRQVFCRYEKTDDEHGGYLRKIKTFSSQFKIWNISPKNTEQKFALEALLNPDIKVVTIIGAAGTGKTLLSVAAGLQQIFTVGSGEKTYNRMLISRPIQTLGNDIGFLPGSIEEKLEPWIAPIKDNLQVLTQGDKEKVDGWFDKGKIEIQAMPYIRGRSIPNSFIIIDEAQNLDDHEIKTIMTRVGLGSKIVLTGDVQQIDNPSLTESSNGLRYLIEKFKEFNLSSHTTLIKGERSEVATIASEVL